MALITKTKDRFQDEAIDFVLVERRRQDAKFGPQSHDPSVWLQILTEEVGEYSQACLHDRFGGKAKGTALKELIHTAAVAVAMVEDTLRKGQTV